MIWTNEQLEDSLKASKSSIEDTLEKWDIYVTNWQKKGKLQEGIGVLNLSNATASQSISIKYLLLLNKKEAMHWAEQAALYFKKSAESGLIQGNIEYSSWLSTLEMAIISCNKKLIEDVASPISKLEQIGPEICDYYLKSISNIILYRDREALNYVGNLERIEGKQFRRFKGWFEGPGTALKGILLNDKILVVKGVTRVLQIFKNRIRGRDHKLPLCIPAIVLLILARDRGITIKKEDVDEKLRGYIPWILLEDD